VYIADPVLIASIVLAGFGGLFVGLLLTTRIMGGCIIAVLGTAVLAIVVMFFIHGDMRFVYDATWNLGRYIQYEFPAFVAFLVGFFVGAARRRLSS
jgi:hypothetical protein